MWELYNKLIAEIQEDVMTEEVVVGQIWTATTSSTKMTGLASSSVPIRNSNFVPGSCQGRSVKELASSIKSWDFMEAAIGLSAINSVLNSKETMKEIMNSGFRQLPEGSAFDLLEDEIKGKKVAIIGHFPNVEELSELCHLAVLERKPSNEDLPDSAAEYLLPKQDIVFITSSTSIT